MESLILFLSKSILISGLLTAWYVLGLRGRRLHQYNRYFLLSILFFSLTIPFLHFRLFNIPVVVPGNLAPAASLIQPGIALSAGPAVINQPAHDQWSWVAISAVIISAISLLLLVVLAVKIFNVLKMCRQNEVTQLAGINLVLTDSPKAPFTFLKYVFWNRSLPLDDEIGQLIFRHEVAHIVQGHTYDKIACQVITCIFWFNPFYWIIQKELNIVHEFEADEHAIGNNDTEAFAMMLLRPYNGGRYLAPEHYFFSSNVKRRMAMLQNVSKPSRAMLRRFIAVPLIAAIVLLFSFGCRTGMSADMAPAKKKIVLLIDAAHGGLDAGAESGEYVEKDICLKYAQRIAELSAAYNVDVRLTRSDDQYVVLSNRVAISEQIKPDVFISLHVNDEPGKDKEKGDFDIYISGQNAQAVQSSNYSNGIFQAMTQDGIIPGGTKTARHNAGCTCDSCKTAASVNAEMAATKEERFYVLKHSRFPGMVMVLGNIKNGAEMQQLSEDSRRDMLCNAILKGIVAGAAEKDASMNGNTNFLLQNQSNSNCR